MYRGKGRGRAGGGEWRGGARFRPYSLPRAQDEAKEARLTAASADEVMEAIGEEEERKKRLGLPQRHELWAMGEGSEK